MGVVSRELCLIVYMKFIFRVNIFQRIEEEEKKHINYCTEECWYGMKANGSG